MISRARILQECDIVAYKRFKDHPGGQFADSTFFGIVLGLSTRDVEGFEAKEWVDIIGEDGDNKCIMPSQVIHAFKDVIG